MTKSLSAAVILLACAPAPGVAGLQARDPGEEDHVSFQMRKVAALPGIGDVSDLDLLPGDGSPLLLVAGTCGSAVVDLAQGSVEAAKPFALPCPPFLSSRIIDVDGDGRDDFARFETGWVGPTAVLDQSGAVRWQHPAPAACANVLDLDGDHKGEILVREANSEMVELLDHDGRARWKRRMPGDEVVVFDVDHDGKQELLVIDGKQLVIYGADGYQVRTTSVPGGGYVNTVQIAMLGTESATPEILVGAYISEGADKGQWYHRFASDAKTHLGRQRTGTDVRHEFMAAIPAADGRGQLFLTLLNHKEQAFPAGFKASELALYVTSEEGERVGEQRFSKADKNLAVADGALLVLEGAPSRVLVGYGDGLWEVTIQ